MSKVEKSRIIFLDIETTPFLGWAWQKWDTSIIDIKSNWYILSFAYKVLGEKQVYVHSLPDYPGYDHNKEDDKQLVKELWRVVDEADIVIGHNADKFDVRKSNTRFIFHGLKPPSPYKVVDTLKIARKVFRFDSNKLDELGRYLGLGRKLPHTGFHLWHGCMVGDSDAWKLMVRYNLQDIRLLERVYALLKPWATNHPNVNRGEFACPKCSSKRVQKRGLEYTQHRVKQRYCCQSCAGWFTGPATKEQSE